MPGPQVQIGKAGADGLDFLHAVVAVVFEGVQIRGGGQVFSDVLIAALQGEGLGRGVIRAGEDHVLVGHRAVPVVLVLFEGVAFFGLDRGHDVGAGANGPA